MKYFILLIATTSVVTCLNLGGLESILKPVQGQGAQNVVGGTLSLVGGLNLGGGLDLQASIGSIVGTASKEVVDLGASVSGVIDLKTAMVVGPIVSATGDLIPSVADFLVKLLQILSSKDIAELGRGKLRAEKVMDQFLFYYSSDIAVMDCIALHKEPAVVAFLNEPVSAEDKRPALKAHYYALQYFYRDLFSTCPSNLLGKDSYNKFLFNNIIQNVSISECAKVYTRAKPNTPALKAVVEAEAFLARESTVKLLNDVKACPSYLAIRSFLSGVLRADLPPIEAILASGNIDLAVVIVLHHIITDDVFA